MKRPRTPLAYSAVVAGTFLALATTLCAIVQWRYAIFRNDVDLGIFTQVIAGLGHRFSSTAEGGVNHLLVHWSPIIATAWPFLRLFGPVGLEYFQAIIVAATLFPLWGLARKRFNQIPAVALVVVASLYPILWANGVGDFHEMAFVPLLSATLVYALDRRRWLTSLVAASLLACTREDQFVVLATNGVLFAVTATRDDGKARRAGWAIAVLAIVMCVAYFGIVRPALNSHVPYQSLKFFDWSGASGGKSLWTLLFARIGYVLAIIGPLALLPCISRYGLFLIPGFVEILASREPVTLAPGAHYSALLTGYALAAFVDGAGRLWSYKPFLAKGFVAVAGVVSVCVGIFASPMEYWYYLYRRPNAHDALLDATLRQLPRSAYVGAESQIFAHLGMDAHASINFDGQDWFVYDRTAYSSRWHEIDEPAVSQAIAQHQYIVIDDRDGIVTLKKAGELRN